MSEDAEQARVAQAWSETQARLPAGWTLEGLRCASTGLDTSQRSEEWIALAIGPDGRQRDGRATDPVEALRRLATGLADGSEGT